jgi:hypothetical protein
MLSNTIAKFVQDSFDGLDRFQPTAADVQPLRVAAHLSNRDQSFRALMLDATTQLIPLIKSAQNRASFGIRFGGTDFQGNRSNHRESQIRDMVWIRY